VRRVALLLGLLSSLASAPAVAAPSGALEGPWRWLGADVVWRTAGWSSLGAGPWREPSITLDGARRLDEIDRLEAELVARDGELVGLWEAHRAEQFAVVLRDAALDSAQLLEAAGESAAAARAYAAVIDAGGMVLVDVWHGLAANLARAGDVLGAERAFLRGLDASGRASDQIRFRYDLAGFYAQEGRLDEAAAVIDALAPHVPDSGPLDSARESVFAALRLAQAIHPRGLAVAWPGGMAEPEPGWEVFDPRVAAMVEWLPESWSRGLLPVARRVAEYEGLRSGLALGALGLVLLALFVLLRQRGDVAVAIEYPEELRGIFQVRMRNGRRTPPEPATEDEIREGGASTRKTHQLVSRETQFQRLFVGRYHLVIDGLLVDPESEEVLGRVREEKVVRVRHRRTVRVEFDVHPSTCPVDLRVVWGDRPAEEARVTVPGFIDKPRAAAGGAIRIMLPKGGYRLLVGCGDRVFDHAVSVSSFRPSSLTLDVLTSEAVFKGCPPAVEPYLRNDLPAVARALERDGQAEVGFRLLAAKHQADGDTERAADFFESAGDPRAAAKLRLELGDLGRAAALFERAEDWIEAARAHRSNGQVFRAGECYEQALDYASAIDCYREAGAIDHWLTALERYGDVFPAAKLALEHDQRPRAIRLLQRVDPNDEDFREACALLAEAFETEGHYDLAAAKLDEHIATFRPNHATADTYSRLAELWEQAGHLERALDVLEDLRRREPTFPNVAARIERLRKQRSASGHLYSSGSRPTDGGATAFVGDVRYDLLEEIGRGGMGVVYRARDTRLDRIVALKRLPEGLRRHHPRALQFFLREAQSAARLNHPNIVTLYDADQQDGQFFITMELLEGQPLQAILHERGQLSPSNVLGIARQVCRGLDYAHAQGVIHRDIKTANLFVTTDRVVKIMDFGLAKVLEEVRGATTLVSGTPYYMSPDQVLGRDVDHRADLYSLGVTLFELATGRVPFDSGEVAYHHRHSPVPDPRSLRAELPNPLVALILHLLEKEPEQRPQSAAEVLRRLTSIDPEAA
jgi:tetratricopeptide (TPR) repeat protein